jgi:hypothetical protein
MSGSRQRKNSPACGSNAARAGFVLINALQKESRHYGQVNFYVGIPFASR